MEGLASAGGMKNSEFVGMVAELLELNLKALDRTQKRVEEHNPGASQWCAGGGGPAQQQRDSAEAPPARRLRSSSPSLVTAARAEAKRQHSAAHSTAHHHHSDLQRTRSGTSDGWDRSTAVPPPSGSRRRGFGPPLKEIRRFDSELRMDATATSASTAATGTARRRRGSSTTLRRGPSATSASGRRGSSRDRLNTSLCADNGQLVTVTTVDIGATPAERNAFHLRLLDAIDSVIALPPCEHIQAYHCTYRKGRKMDIYRESLDLPCLAGNLKKMSGLLRRSELKLILTRVLQGLDHLHSAGCAHGYIRAASVHSNGKEVKLSTPLIDWASRTEWAGKEGPWLPPEQLRLEGKQEPTPQADIWALGCLAMELLTGFKAWHHIAPTREAMRRVLASATAPLPLPKGVEGDAADFLKGCLAALPERRATAAALLQHRWLAEGGDRDLRLQQQKSALKTPTHPPSAAPQPSSLLRQQSEMQQQHSLLEADPFAMQPVVSMRDASCSPLLMSTSLAQRVPSIPAPLDRDAVESVLGSHGIAASSRPASFTASRPETPLGVSLAPSVSRREIGGGGGGGGHSPLRRADTAPLKRTASTPVGGVGTPLKSTPAHSVVPAAAVPQSSSSNVLQELKAKTTAAESKMQQFEETMQTLLERQEATNSLLSVMHASRALAGAGGGGGGGGGGAVAYGGYSGVPPPTPHVHFAPQGLGQQQQQQQPPLSHPYAAWGGMPAQHHSPVHQPFGTPIVVSR